MPLHNRIAAKAVFAVAAVCATPSMAWGEQSLAPAAEQTIYLRAFVPVYCEVDLAPAGGQLANGVVPLGRSTELCNAPRGYKIILQHPSGLTNAAVIVDETRVPLSATGETVLVDSDHPDLHIRQLALDPGNQTSQIGNLGIRIEVNY
jgi:hypothetical protein